MTKILMKVIIVFITRVLQLDQIGEEVGFNSVLSWGKLRLVRPAAEEEHSVGGLR
jgi:hypothetical protein